LLGAPIETYGDNSALYVVNDVFNHFLQVFPVHSVVNGFYNS